jgi:hypothetical protein
MISSDALQHGKANKQPLPPASDSFAAVTY